MSQGRNDKRSKSYGGPSPKAITLYVSIDLPIQLGPSCLQISLESKFASKTGPIVSASMPRLSSSDSKRNTN